MNQFITNSIWQKPYPPISFSPSLPQCLQSCCLGTSWCFAGLLYAWKGQWSNTLKLPEVLTKSFIVTLLTSPLGRVSWQDSGFDLHLEAIYFAIWRGEEGETVTSNVAVPACYIFNSSFFSFSLFLHSTVVSKNNQAAHARLFLKISLDRSFA